MDIRNPYKPTEHIVFKRTFLQSTEVGVRFEPPIPMGRFVVLALPFLNKTFNQEADAETAGNACRAEVRSSDGQIRFTFTSDSAKVVIGHAAYKSFAPSAIPFVQVLIKFAKEVADARMINEAHIKKTNLWPIASKDSKKFLKGASLYVFKREHVNDIASMTFEDAGYPVSVTKDAVVACGDQATLKATLKAELDTPSSSKFILELDAKAISVGPDEIILALTQLNDIIFSSFMNVVSDNIIELMSKNDP